MNPLRTLFFSLIFISLALIDVKCFGPDGAIVPSQPQPSQSDLALNNNLYIFNTQNYTWVNTFDASNIYGSDEKNSNSFSLGAIIGTIIGVVIAVGIVTVVGFFLYKKFLNRK
ncbi:7108_t:CDS:2, partial [Dentiscutata heterogama]